MTKTTIFRPNRLLAAVALVLAACASGPPSQFLMDAPTSQLRLRPLIGSLEVRDVSLPRYATADGLTTQQPDGSLVTDSSRVWADDPERVATLALARNLSAITGARVAAEPWPFAEPPAATVSVSVEQFLATGSGTLRLEGSYAVAPLASGLADRGGRFDIAVPLPPEAGPSDLARAHGEALRQLSETVARRVAR